VPHRTGVAWVRPTLRLIPWWGLALPSAATALVGLLVRAAGGGVPQQVGVAALAATAAAAPQVLDDPAHDLLSPVPQNRRRRVGHRLLLSLPALVLAWALVAPLVVERRDPTALSVGRLLALAAIGLAGGCLAGRVLPDLAAPVGTVLPLAVVALRLALADRVTDARILDVWIDHPWATAGGAGLVCSVSLRDYALRLRPRRRRWAASRSQARPHEVPGSRS
jgi:hypothetical protein